MDWDVQQRELTRIEKLKYLVINWKLTLTEGISSESIQFERKQLKVHSNRRNIAGVYQIRKKLTESSL